MQHFCEHKASCFLPAVILVGWLVRRLAGPSCERTTGYKLRKDGEESVLYWTGQCVQRWLVVLQSLSCVQLVATPGTVACLASLFFTTSRSLLKLMSIELMMPSNHPILCHPLLQGNQWAWKPSSDGRLRRREGHQNSCSTVSGRQPASSVHTLYSSQRKHVSLTKTSIKQEYLLQ